MNIGLFTDTYYPQINGVATSVLMLKKNLELKGHKVFVFTTTDPKASKEKNVFRVPSIPFNSGRRIGTFYNPHLARFIEKLNLDVIHTHTEFSLGIFGRVMARKLNIPFLHTYHTIYEDYTHYLGKLAAFRPVTPVAKTAVRKMSTKFCNSADEVVVPTKKVKDLLLSYNVRRNISIIPTGINLNKFSKCNYESDCLQSLRSTLGIGANDKVLLYIGRISKEKNIEEVLTFLKSYLSGRKDVKFVLIGDGPEKSNLEDMVKELGIGSQTIFAGERAWDEIGMYYKIGDIFISASQSETQGITYIEALASGLPVVAKADKCLDGVLENNINGYSFNTQEEFIKAVDSILYNDLQLERLSIGAVKSAGKFSAESFADTVEALYINIISMNTKKLRIG